MNLLWYLSDCLETPQSHLLCISTSLPIPWSWHNSLKCLIFISNIFYIFLLSGHLQDTSSNFSLLLSFTLKFDIEFFFSFCIKCVRCVLSTYCICLKTAYSCVKEDNHSWFEDKNTSNSILIIRRCCQACWGLFSAYDCVCFSQSGSCCSCSESREVIAFYIWPHRGMSHITWLCFFAETINALIRYWIKHSNVSQKLYPAFRSCTTSRVWRCQATWKGS